MASGSAQHPYSHPQEMASYNQWQNEVLYTLCAALKDSERKRARRMFFRSIHDTLDHILTIDRLIVGYLEQGTRPPARLERQYEDFAGLHAARVAMDEQLIEQARAMTPEWLSSEVAVWSERLNRERRLKRGLLVSQMFNHQTHHRSQVTAHLHVMGIDYGCTDLPFNPKATY